MPTDQLYSYETSKHTVFWFFFKGLKCHSQDEKNNDEFAEIAKRCLSNVSSWDSPSKNNDRDYNNGRLNENRHHSNRQSYDGNVDNNHDGMYNRYNGDYNTHDNNGDNDNRYGMWRKQQNSGGKFMIHEVFDLFLCEIK